MPFVPPTTQRTIADAVAATFNSDTGTLALLADDGKTIRTIHAALANAGPYAVNTPATVIDLLEPHLAAFGLSPWGQVGEEADRVTVSVIATDPRDLAPLDAMALPIPIHTHLLDTAYLAAVQQDDGTYELHFDHTKWIPVHLGDTAPILHAYRPPAGRIVADVAARDIPAVVHARWGVQLVGPPREWLVMEKSGAATTRTTQHTPGGPVRSDGARPPRLRRCVVFHATRRVVDDEAPDEFHARLSFHDGLLDGIEMAATSPRAGLYVSATRSEGDTDFRSVFDGTVLVAADELVCPDDGNLWTWVGSWVDLYCRRKQVTRTSALRDLDVTVNDYKSEIAVTFDGVPWLRDWHDDAPPIWRTGARAAP